MLAIRRQRDVKLAEEPDVCFGSRRPITQQDEKRNWELQIDSVPVGSEMDASVVVSAAGPHLPITAHYVAVCA